MAAPLAVEDGGESEDGQQEREDEGAPEEEGRGPGAPGDVEGGDEPVALSESGDEAVEGDVLAVGA